MLICIDPGHCLSTPGKRCLKSIDPGVDVLGAGACDGLQLRISLRDPWGLLLHSLDPLIACCAIPEDRKLIGQRIHSLCNTVEIRRLIGPLIVPGLHVCLGPVRHQDAEIKTHVTSLSQ